MCWNKLSEFEQMLPPCSAHGQKLTPHQQKDRSFNDAFKFCVKKPFYSDHGSVWGIIPHGLFIDLFLHLAAANANSLA